MEQITRICPSCQNKFRPRPGKEDLDKFCPTCYLAFCKRKADEREERKERADQRQLDKAQKEYNQPSLLAGEDEEDETTVVKVLVLPEQKKRLARMAYEKNGSTLTEWLSKLVNSL